MSGWTWVTRERVKVDHVAYPWLIRTFIDKDAEFLFVPGDKVMEVARQSSQHTSTAFQMAVRHHLGILCGARECDEADRNQPRD